MVIGQAGTNTDIPLHRQKSTATADKLLPWYILYFSFLSNIDIIENHLCVD